MTVTRRNHGRNHSYYIDGVKVPGVTTLIGDGIPKPALVGWAANITAGYAVDNWDDLAALPVSKRLDLLKRARYDDLDQASKKGTAVHAWAERVVHGEDVGEDIPDYLRGHVESYVRFLDEWDVQPVLVEVVVASRKYNYCGTCDLVADVRTGQRLLMDIKTSRSGIFGETALQLAAYANAETYVDQNGDEQPMADLGIEGTAAIHVRADGYDVRPLELDEAFAMFRHAAWIARRMDAMRDFVGDALPAPAVEVSA